jgi:hypothetical protein
LIGSPVTCLFVVYLTRSSNPNFLFTRFLKRLSISAFPSPVHTLFRFALKSTDFPMLLILISAFDLFFAPLSAFLLSFLSRIKFLSFWDLVLYTYLSIEAVPQCESNHHAQFTHQSIGTHGTHSYNRTAVIQSSPVMSSISSHLNTTGHSANFDDYKILSTKAFSYLSSNLLLTSGAALFLLIFCKFPLSFRLFLMSVLFLHLYRPIIHTSSYPLLSLVT